MILGSYKKKIVEKEDKGPFCLTDTLAIALSGKIEANEDKWVQVFPVVSGTVEEMKVQLGDYVSQGQTLAVIKCGEMADYQCQLAYAKSSVMYPLQ